jgi:RloB-like protein
LNVSRRAQSFSRPSARFRPQPRVLVLCEDTKSGKNYLEDASRHYRSFALVEFAHCGHTDPLGIVTEAVARERDFDEIYCVLDRDTHHGWDAALALSKTSAKVKVIPSYPCFEYWLLIHFEFSRSPYASVGNVSAADRVIKDLIKKPGMASYAKGYKENLFDALFEKLDTAHTHARRSVAQAAQDGELNPSTYLHELLDRLSILSKPQLK